MSDIFDKLTRKLTDGDGSDAASTPDKPSEGDSTGISTAEIMELPRPQRDIMLLMMRDRSPDGMTQDQITAKLPNAADIPGTLEKLNTEAWLTITGDAPNLHYRANLRRKRGANNIGGIWSSVMDHLEETPAPTKPKPRADLFKRLE